MELSEAALTTALHRAMKDRDTVRVSVLRAVIAAIKNTKVEQRTAELPPDQIVGLVRREVKQRREVEEIARTGGRSDVLHQAEAELAILESLLPAQLAPEELEAAIRGLCAGGAASIGDVMRALQERYPGRIDGKAASALARRALTGAG